MTPFFNSADLGHIAPLLFLASWACLLLLASTFLKHHERLLLSLASLGISITFGLVLWAWHTHSQPALDVFAGMVFVDRFALFFDAMFLLAGLITLFLSAPFFRVHCFFFDEYPSLLLLILCGLCLMVHAGDFVVLLIGLEIGSLGIYALAASWTGQAKSAEAGLKYFVMGAVASACFIYGLALLYGATGETHFLAIQAKSSELAGKPLFLLGMFFILGAMAFKIALVPFHAWAPDVYSGSPTPIAAFLATAVKAAGFGALLRLLILVFGSMEFTFGSTGWSNVLWFFSLITMIVGNITALRQDNIKRLLAYSSISHAGYLLLGVLASCLVPEEGESNVLFYLLAYLFTTLGAFGMVVWLTSRENEHLDITHWSGLSKRHPLAALGMTIFLLSLGGIPPTAGFFAKFFLFKAALGHEGLTHLVIAAALNSAVSLFYYLRPIVVMYFGEPSETLKPIRSNTLVIALWTCAILTLLLGLAPSHVLAWARASGMLAIDASF